MDKDIIQKKTREPYLLSCKRTLYFRRKDCIQVEYKNVCLFLTSLALSKSETMIPSGIIIRIAPNMDFHFAALGSK